jgi:Ala-tRNA(Pro) deacylase
MTSAEQRLFSDFERLGVDHAVAEHEAVFTVEQSSRLHRDLPGAHTKNLFLKDGTGRYWLVTIPAEIRADLKRLPAVIGSKRLSFGNAEELRTLLGVEPGSVTPLAAINDAMAKVTVVIDARLVAAGTVNVHPLRNTATVGLAAGDLLRLLGAWGHEPQVVEVPALEVETA